MEDFFRINLRNCWVLLLQEKDFPGDFFGMMAFIVKLQLENNINWCLKLSKVGLTPCCKADGSLDSKTEGNRDNNYVVAQDLWRKTVVMATHQPFFLPLTTLTNKNCLQIKLFKHITGRN